MGERKNLKEQTAFTFISNDRHHLITAKSQYRLHGILTSRIYKKCIYELLQLFFFEHNI